MLLTESLQTRLSDWINSNYYVEIKGVWKLVETTRDGEAEIDIHVDDALAFIRLEGDDKFPHLSNRKCADAAILEFKPQRTILHLFECKRTIKKDKWLEIKQQFEGALLRTLGILGVLGINGSNDIDEVRCYTAFRRDMLSKNPVILKSVDGNSPLSDMLDWYSDEVQLLSITSCIHKKIQLDYHSGQGLVVL